MVFDIVNIKKIFLFWFIIQSGILYSSNLGNIVITEFFFAPSTGSDIYEYIEIYNTTQDAINLYNWNIEIDGVGYIIDESLEITSNNHLILYSNSGNFADNLGVTYCSSDFHPIFNNCDNQREDLYWLQFPSLQDETGVIKIFDANTTLVDAIIYDAAWSEIVGSINAGKSVEFILDPINNGHINNDDNSNWRSSQFESDFLWFGSDNENGSPLISNFIEPYIEIQTLNGSISYLDSSSGDIVYSPVSDGFPGGYVDIQFTETAKYQGTLEETDYREWGIFNSEIVKIDSNSTEIVWQSNPIRKIPESVLDTFSVSLFSKVPIGFMGKGNASLFLKEEINYGPVIESINNQVPSSTNSQTLYYHTYENTFDSLFAVVSDYELCSLECGFTNLDTIIYYDSDSEKVVYNNSFPFLWISDSSHLISTVDSLTTYFTTYAIDSLYNLSANDNPDTLVFTLQVTDPFGVIDSQVVNVVVNNINKPPVLITEFSDTTIFEDSLINFELDGSDIDGDELIYSAETDYGSITQTNGSSLTIKPFDNFNGDLFVNVIVSDGELFDNKTFKLTILPINDPPIIESVLNWPITVHETSGNYYHIAEDTINFEFNLQFHDIDSDDSLNDMPFNINDLIWSFQKLDNENEQHVFASKTTSGFLIENLYSDYNGVTGLKVIVMDDHELKDTLDIQIYIDQRNDSPVISNFSFDPIIDNDTNNYYHLAEDTVNIIFNLQFSDIDSDANLNEMFYDLNNLTWSFHKLDIEDTQRVFASQIAQGFKIDSVLSNFNGPTGLKVTATDDVGAQSSKEVLIYLEQRNDILNQFNIYPVIKDYCIDPTTIDSVRDILYFRLPQNQNGKSLDSPEKLRFEWEKNDLLDIDMNSDLNNDDLLTIYYRLESVLNDTFFILDDSINHLGFQDNVSIFTEINLTDDFSYYIDSYENHVNNSKTKLDITGEATYKWRVIAQNYSIDNLGNDPFTISNGWDNTKFKIDLIPPQVTGFNIISNNIYAEYYDIIWNSSELYLTDLTFLTISEDHNQFGSISQLNPRQITDYLYHFTGNIPNELTNATISYLLEVQDQAMNSGERTDKVTYTKLDPNNDLSFTSPSGLADIFIEQSGVNRPIDIFITEKKIEIASKRIETNLFQISPSIHFNPKDIILNNEGEISFDIKDYLSPDIDEWQYVIANINNGEHEELCTYYSNGIVSTQIRELTSYAVFVNLDNTKPLPPEFILVKNYPNPFNPTTTILLEIPEESFVKASIYNILGQEVIILLEDYLSPGYQNLQWNGSNQSGQQVSSGLYIVKVLYNEKVFKHKMMLLK